MALHSLYMKNPSTIPDVRELAKKCVGDNDPGVVSSSLHIFYDLIKVCSLLKHYMQVYNVPAVMYSRLKSFSL